MKQAEQTKIRNEVFKMFEEKRIDELKEKYNSILESDNASDEESFFLRMVNAFCEQYGYSISYIIQ